MRKEAIDFGKFLMDEDLIFSGYRDTPTPEGLVTDVLWDTSEGEWLTMEQLYEKWRKG